LVAFQKKYAGQQTLWKTPQSISNIYGSNKLLWVVYKFAYKERVQQKRRPSKFGITTISYLGENDRFEKEIVGVGQTRTREIPSRAG
jgi:hypothetical protein